MDRGFGAWLKQARKEAGKTQRTVAEEVGIDFTYVSKIENEAPHLSTTGRPSEATIRRLAEVVGVDPDEAVWRAGKLPAGFVDTVEALSWDDFRHVWSAAAARRTSPTPLDDKEHQG